MRAMLDGKRLKHRLTNDARNIPFLFQNIKSFREFVATIERATLKNASESFICDVCECAGLIAHNLSEHIRNADVQIRNSV